MSKQKILEAYKEVVEGIDEAKGIEGNWKPIVQAFNQLYGALERLRTLGAFGDKKFGKRLTKIENDVTKLTNDLDKSFGPPEELSF